MPRSSKKVNFSCPLCSRLVKILSTNRVIPRHKDMVSGTTCLNSGKTAPSKETH